MPISAKAIERYLDAPIPHVPNFKGMRKDALYEWIEYLSGADYDPPSRPWQHQLEGLAFALWAQQHGGALLFYGMRTGKTRICLEWAHQLRISRQWRGPGLIIAHAPIGLEVWGEQLPIYAPELSYRLVRNDIYEFMDAMDSNCDLIVTPWSGLQAMFNVRGTNKKGQDKFFADLEFIRKAAEHFQLIGMDEIHLCKNHQSLRFQIAAALTGKADFRLGLTGTPIGRSGYAVWAEAFLADRGRALGYNYYFFEQAFGKSKKNWFSKRPEWTFNNRLLVDLRRKLTPLAIACELEEVRDIDVRPRIVRLRVRGDQEEAYRSVVEDAIKLKNDEVVEINNSFIRLRQIASGYLPFIDDDGIEHVVEFKRNVKLEWLASFLENSWDQETPLVIFHEFTRTGEMICKTLAKQKIKHAWFYGGAKDDIGEYRAFRTGKVRVMVANTAKGGMSIDLSRSDYLIFYESPVTAIIRKQAEARPLAATRGNTPLLLDDLVCAPIEERILAFVKEGRDAMAALMSSRAKLRLT